MKMYCLAHWDIGMWEKTWRGLINKGRTKRDRTNSEALVRATSPACWRCNTINTGDCILTRYNDTGEAQTDYRCLTTITILSVTIIWLHLKPFLLSTICRYVSLNRTVYSIEKALKYLTFVFEVRVTKHDNNKLSFLSNQFRAN